MQRSPGPSCHSFPFSSLCSAFFTRILLPPSSRPLSSLMAAFASPGRGISTKPNPLDLPVSRSITSLQYNTAPKTRNNTHTSFSLVSRDKLRTNIFICTPSYVIHSKPGRLLWRMPVHSSQQRMPLAVARFLLLLCLCCCSFVLFVSSCVCSG